MSLSREIPFALQGQVLLPLVLMISSLAVIASLTIGFLGIFEGGSISRERGVLSSRTLAESGINDALLRIARNTNTENLAGYTIAVTGGSVQVVIDRDNPQVGQTTVIATGIPQGYVVRKQLKAIVQIDVLGRARVLSLTEEVL